MISRTKAFPKKRNTLNFAKKNLINENGKESSKNESNISTYDSNNYSIFYKNKKRSKLFLDYTFQENKIKLQIGKNKENLIDNAKVKTYYYELKKTFTINLDLLLYYYNNKSDSEEKEKNKEENNEILKLLNNIKKKIVMKNEIKLSIKQKCNVLITKYDNLYSEQKKLNNQINIYNIKINNNLSQINQKNLYISMLEERFSYIDIYINKLRFVSEGRKGLKHSRHKLKKCIEKNNKNLLRIKNNNNEIKKIKANISELKKDNKLLKKQSRLMKSKKPNINLIRVVEFYIRIIRNLSMRNKSLKNSINSLCKTLEFLDLKQIKDFTEYKRTRQKSSYEIEFSDLENNYYEENKCDNLANNNMQEIVNNLNNFIDFSKVLNI